MSVQINYNPALQTSFRLLIPGLESFNYFSQNATIPGLSSSAIGGAFRDSPTKYPTDRIDYDNLSVNFIVSEDFSNHAQLRTWLWEFHRGSDPIWHTTKNIQLLVTNSNMVPYIRVEFYFAFPVSIGQISFDSTVTENDVQHCTVDFSYQYYEIYRL